MLRSRPVVKSACSSVRAQQRRLQSVLVAPQQTLTSSRSTAALSSSRRRILATTSQSTPVLALNASRRSFATVTDHEEAPIEEETAHEEEVERAEDDVDVCIVGGGPAGLSAAIRLKQLEQETGKEIRVVVLEKGGEVGESRVDRVQLPLGRSKFSVCGGANQVHTSCLELCSSPERSMNCSPAGKKWKTHHPWASQRPLMP